MALIDELKEQLKKAVEFVDTETAIVRVHTRNVEDWLGRIDDLDRAIAALQPTEELIAALDDAAFVQSEELLDELTRKTLLAPTLTAQPETWEAMEVAEQDIAAEQLLREEDEVFSDAYGFEIISELTGDPAIEPESGLHGEAVSEEGYAPVTSPEADAVARAQDWYSPEQVAEREKASAKWPGLGTLWGKPKVDA